MLLLVVIVLLMAFPSAVFADKGDPPKGPADKCTTIQSGELLTSDGWVIPTGYDFWGYNYQAHLFNGFYCDAYRDAAWCQDYRDVKLEMKWNDAWMSNKDCNGDGLLDRHFGFDSYIGSGAWETNHQSGEYEMDGKTCQWNYFVKIVAKPTVDFACETIWGEFCVIQQVENDPCAGIHGLQFISPDGAGLGNW